MWYYKICTLDTSRHVHPSFDNKAVIEPQMIYTFAS